MGANESALTLHGCKSTFARQYIVLSLRKRHCPHRAMSFDAKIDGNWIARWFSASGMISDQQRHGQIMTKVLVLYYSSYGHMEAMAYAAAEGVQEAGAEAVVKRV